jgi:uncharacterized repeat protein (TIGR03803 family)
MRQYVSSIVSIRNPSICVMILLVSSLTAAAQHETVLYAFGTNRGSATYPSGSLIADAAGNLYGTTLLGGTNRDGTVFELSPPIGNAPWTKTDLYTFNGGTDGGAPNGTLIFDDIGNLYGTTGGGGDSVCLCGTVFELSPPAAPGGSWTFITLYAFSGGDDGADPRAGVVFDQAENLYGTTAGGGGVGSCGSLLPGCGTVFELSPPAAPGGAWTETLLYSFSGGSDGGEPAAPVVFDEGGNLYGTTFCGGLVDCQSGGGGTVFELTQSGAQWLETVLHGFGTFGDGYSPGAGLFLDGSGALVGTTPSGGSHGVGTVFGLRPPLKSGGKWTYAVLYSFRKSLTDGDSPQGGVISVNGMLYGTTMGGGEDVVGTVFQLALSHGEVWKETGLYSFKGGSDGEAPVAGLLLHSGALYGTTTLGGEARGGTVFSIGK